MKILLSIVFCLIVLLAFVQLILECDINQEFVSLDFCDFVEFEGKIYFIVDDGQFGWELYWYDLVEGFSIFIVDISFFDGSSNIF